MSSLISTMRQAFPGKPRFTAQDVPDLTNQIIIVTGSNTGIGKEAARILYSKNAKVYIMARSEDKANSAISDIKTAVPRSNGELVFMRLDLADLDGVKATAQEFLRREKKLHLLFNSAGVGYPEKGSKTKQGYELQLGVNCVGPFAFAKLLTPLLIATAKVSPSNAVRVVWVSSSAAEAVSPKGFVERLPTIDKASSLDQYFLSKLGNFLHSSEFATRHKADGVVSVSLNPGNLDSEFWRTQGPLLTWILRKTVLYPPINGAYTMLFAGHSPEVTLEKSGSHIAPWGRLWTVSNDMVNATKTKAQGGTETAAKFWDWTEAQVEPYL